MKTLLSLLFVAGIMVSMSSCKEEFDCTCVDALIGPEYEKTGKGDTAEEACADESKLLTLTVCVPSTAK